MTDAVIQYRDEDTETVFRWHGGAYVDVGYVLGSPTGVGDERFMAQDVINVWDDEADASTFEVEVGKVGLWPPRRPFRSILEAFEDRCRLYLDDDQEQ